jgi:hypothetical protein
VVSDVEADQFRRVEGKTFQLEKTKWVDVEYRSSMPLRTVEFLSEDYFRLLKDNPKLGPYLALGPEVLIVDGANPVQVAFNPGR